MIFNKKVIESTVLAGLLIITTTVTATTTHVISGTMNEKEVAKIESNTVVLAGQNGTAGVIGVLGQTAGVTLVTVDASIEQAEVQVVTSGEEVAGTEAIMEAGTETTVADTGEVQANAVIDGAPVETAVVEETLSPEQQVWSGKLMANVEQSLNVRQAADENSELIGKLYAGDAADIVEVGDTWTHITSGSVDGYVMNSYCVMGIDAYAYAQANCATMATALTGGLRLRSEPNPEAAVVNMVAEGEKLTVDISVDAGPEWVAVTYDGTACYVSAEFVSVELNVGTAITLEEEQAIKAKEAAEAAKKSQVASSGTTKNASVAASADEVTLLGALIQCEAGAESYEGQLAVGAVVMNRLRSGYSSSLYGVIYAGGQFTPAGSGAVANVIASGVKGSCMQAAQDAIGGSDNTGGARSFRSVNSGHAGVVIGNHVFW